MSRPDYGYDAPYALVMFAAATTITGIGAIIFLWQGLGRGALTMGIYFVFFGANTSSFFYTTGRGKFIEWEKILDGLHLRGDEQVLDMGCGRGAVLNAVARRLTAGHVTGVDIWSTTDQSGKRGKSPYATRHWKA